MKWVALFATVLLLAQLAEHTEAAFAMLSFCYIFIFAFAFNLAGGFYFPSGAWILLNGTLTVVIGVVYKLFVNEPGENNLGNPTKTMFLFCVAMAMYGLAAYLSSVTRPKQALMETASQGEQMKKAAIGCLIAGWFLAYATLGGDRASASLASAFAQLNHFLRMAIILGTVYEIKASHGKRSANWIVWLAGVYPFFMGLAYFSKEGMFLPLSTWLVPAIVLRFNFSRFQVIGIGLALTFMFYYLVPYSQVGRQSRDPDGNVMNNIKAMPQYLEHLGDVRKVYLETAVVEDRKDVPHFYTKDQGLFDRLQMLAYDDAMIKYTDEGNVFGLYPTYASFANSVPHFLWKDKPNFSTGNTFGRELGVISDDDLSTGISFSPMADAYHEATWFGVLVLLPFTMYLLFFVADSLSGDVRKAPWGLLYIAIFTHIAPEGLLQGQIYTLVYGSEAVIFVTLAAKYVMPLLTNLLTGGERTRVRRTMQFPVAGRVQPRTDPAAGDVR